MRAKIAFPLDCGIVLKESYDEATNENIRAVSSRLR